MSCESVTSSPTRVVLTQVCGGVCSTPIKLNFPYTIRITLLNLLEMRPELKKGKRRNQIFCDQNTPRPKARVEET